VKRKVKFQEGGPVESPRNRQLRETMERFGREGRRVGLAERARQRELARRAAAAERAAARREVERLNPGQGAAEAERRAGRAVPERRPDFTTDPRGTTRRGAATGREVVPRPEAPPPRPSMQRAMTDVLTPRQMPLGRVRPPVGGNLATMAAGTAVAAAEPLADYARSFMDRRAAEADARREANLQAFRDQQQERMTMEQDLGEAAPRMPTPRPAAPRRPAAPPPRPRIREMTADELNEMELRRARAERQMEEDDARERRRREEEAARQMGGSGNIGSASARERGELEGHPGDFTYNNYKKGGMVKPKKMMKGGIVAKPKVAAKSKPKPKPMPFKKGGMIKKGKK
jgi:hypothetical protein